MFSVKGSSSLRNDMDQEVGSWQNVACGHPRHLEHHIQSLRAALMNARCYLARASSS